MVLALEKRQISSLFQINGLRNGEAEEFCNAFGYLKLPESGSSVLGQDTLVMWNGPGMWMIESETVEPAQLRVRLKQAFQETDATTVDLSSARSIVRVSGPNALRLLKKGCPADVDAMRDQSVVSSLIGHISVMIRRHDAVYDIYAMQTFGDDLWHWLRHNAREFGIGQ